MKEGQDYIQDLAEIRTMMERSSKFLTLSGWAGIAAGLYSLFSAWVAYSILNFKPNSLDYTFINQAAILYLALITLIFALSTAIFFSWKNGRKNSQSIWNVTSKRMLGSMAVPLLSGGILMLLLMYRGFHGMLAPLSLLFYGLALFTGGFYTVREVRMMGLVQIFLGVLNFWLIETGLLLWAIGFGLVHIIYGIYMYTRFER